MTAAVSALAALRAEYARLLAAGAATVDPLRAQLAGALLARCEQQRPGVVHHLRTRAAQQLEALAAKLDCGATPAVAVTAGPRPAREALAGLRQLLREREAHQPLSPRQQFEAELRAQERAVFGSAGPAATEGHNPSTGGGDLLAAIRFLDLQAGQAADRELAALRAALPEDPGPLNPQALVIRSLATLQRISPAYVERFLQYSRSLCWLDSVANSRR